LSPSTMRSSVQYSLVCSDSSEAKSSNGPKVGPGVHRHDRESGFG
jgi:hypothetical protein